MLEGMNMAVMQSYEVVSDIFQEIGMYDSGQKCINKFCNY